jgi:YesN/AraC family two-component response regulator
MNPSYLSTLFKKEVGMSISEYVQSVKVNEAKNLLSYTSYSMSNIASLLNFYDQRHFIRVFKNIQGLHRSNLKMRLNS